MSKFWIGFILLGLTCSYSCQEEADTQFNLLSVEQSGVSFVNTITDHDTLSILNYEYIYNGGGVGIGDLNGDDLPDIVFTGNMVDNAIYLNQGGLKFTDISEVSGILNYPRWSTGICLVDINADGKLDIYITSSGHDKVEDKSNLLLINQGNNAEGIPTFINHAKEYGLSSTTNNTHSAFFDYDNDNDLDLMVISNRMPADQSPSRYRKKVQDGSSNTTDHLYRCDWDDSRGHPVYTEISKEAGILTEGYSLGLNITDINQDGWKDIYITNDYLSNDLLYINNQDGTFTDKADVLFKHTSFSAMGNDIVDLDNDGDADIVALDMLPEDNYRKKTMLPPAKYVDYRNNEKYNYQYQFMRNTLQENSGRDWDIENTSAMFNDVACISGINATDWSWAPLIADFDNDGLRDLIVTNGFPKDVTDRDFIDYNMDVNSFASDGFLIDKIPSAKISNYAYKNRGSLQFENTTANWGLDIPSFSNGAAYGDLDNDGDMDFVVNNINEPAFVFENRNHTSEHYLRVSLAGPKNNVKGFGAVLSVTADSTGTQYFDFNPSRGYLSSVEPAVHFGLGNSTKVTNVTVTWPDGKVSREENPDVDQELKISYTSAVNMDVVTPMELSTAFEDVSEKLSLDVMHQEHDYIDFTVQPLLLHKLSQYGPGLSVADVNNDGLEDLFISGSHFYRGKFLLQQADGSFQLDSLIQYDSKEDFDTEELGALFFDADADGDQDLYVVHGGYEYDIENAQYVDKFYENRDGRFHHIEGAIPEIYSSGICVKGADYDQDGDIDLFVGSRVFPGKFPAPVSSYLLVNESNPNQIKFSKLSNENAGIFEEIGMVTDALWTDYDNDGWLDLLLSLEASSLRLYKNERGVLTDVTEISGLQNKRGLWNSLVSGDFDNDGDIDYIAGNFGHNISSPLSEEHPIRYYFKDFDGNGKSDFIPTCYFKNQDGELSEFPYFGRLEMTKQYNVILKKFKFHKDYAVAGPSEIFTPEELVGCLILESNTLSTSYIENLGNGQMRMTDLPREIQKSPIYGMLCDDFNADGYLDVMMVGNDYGFEITTGRLDACDGWIGYGKGDGTFDFVQGGESGFNVQGDAKALVKIYHQSSNDLLYIASQNQGELRTHRNSGANASQYIQLKPMDVAAIYTLETGQSQRHEFYHGAGFISQSTRMIKVPAYVQSISLLNAQGESRDIDLNKIDQ